MGLTVIGAPYVSCAFCCASEWLSASTVAIWFGPCPVSSATEYVAVIADQSVVWRRILVDSVKIVEVLSESTLITHYIIPDGPREFAG